MTLKVFSFFNQILHIQKVGNKWSLLFIPQYMKIFSHICLLGSIKNWSLDQDSSQSHLRVLRWREELLSPRRPWPKPIHLACDFGSNQKDPVQRHRWEWGSNRTAASNCKSFNFGSNEKDSPIRQCTCTTQIYLKGSIVVRPCKLLNRDSN